MNKYKCTSRFPVLILINGVIQELTLGQVVESNDTLSHKFLQEIKVKPPLEELNTVEDKPPKKRGRKPNGK